MYLPGTELKGVMPALLFLEAVSKESPCTWASKVVVIGGGNAAIDSARTALRMGAEVTVIYRRERKDMPAIREETDAAEEEGAKFLFLATPHRIVGNRQGGVQAIEVVKTRLGEYDSSGRRRPVPTDEIQRFECDTVILAVGEAVDQDFVRASGLRIKENGTLEVDRYTLETSRSKFYAGGDLITGASNVSNAMGYGKKAARNIDQRLMGVGRWEQIFPEFDYDMTPPAHPNQSRRHHVRELPAAKRAEGFRRGRDRPVGRGSHGEACRCLRCDIRTGITSKERSHCRRNIHSYRRRIRRRRGARPFSKRPAPTANSSRRSAGWKGLTPVGACRLCIVEVSGVGRLLPACTTPVQDGMSVTTESPKLAGRYRRITLELLFAERNHVCAVCVSNGHCELQAMAQRLGVTSVRYPYAYPKLAVDVSHPRFVLDHNRCILCTRCVRVCAEVEGAHVWDISSRGITPWWWPI